eukprot:CAMPEP_0168563996 /NCGR_PEP_ID=MMETSP0413-20121227/12987_1 /TAXON_ID=136452 /ORGANISM="Filamoeba nolandi, Strain NC-AS-23-1" /LENGTH=171 /DNA_ID=CAMNT_0008595593 /DNA_START=177 /DNA_END=692 /DNA_ORIENTATION=+
MDDALPFRILIDVKSVLDKNSGMADKEKLQLIRRAYAPLESEESKFEEQVQNDNSKQRQEEFLKKYNIDIEGLDNIEYCDKDLYDDNNLIWYGGEGSFTIKDMSFTIKHKYMEDYSEDKVSCSATVGGRYLTEFEKILEEIEKINVTEDQLTNLFHCLAAQWLGGDSVKNY